jgi:peptidoglycan hydrolase-like protein with peptidoglycan-binding domain
MVPHMGASAKAGVLVSALAAALVVAGPVPARVWSSDVAALQVALRAKGVYAGDIDGIAGPQTRRAVRVLQRRARVGVDGVVGPRTRSALGRLGRHQLGRRILRRGMTGWDVAELQFLLAWHGFPSGPFDGLLGRRTEAALLRFQRWSGLVPDGLAGPSTTSVLRAPPPVSPIALSQPVAAPVGEVFGPRGARFHAGVDFPAPSGAPVFAAAAGRVTYAGWLPGGWGTVVTVAHRRGVRTTYAHLSRVDVRVGAPVATGERLGLVGATGNATGPHLHFEVRLRGAFVDPLTALR